MTHPTQEDDVKALRALLALEPSNGPFKVWNDGVFRLSDEEMGVPLIHVMTTGFTNDLTAIDAEWFAACYPERIARLLARLEQAERDGPIMERGKRTDGTPYMGTMREVLNDYKSAAQVEAKEGDKARAELAQLRAAIASEAGK